MEYQELGKSKKNRLLASIFFLVIGLFLLIGGISFADDPFFGTTYFLSGIGFGGMSLLFVLQGLFSKPKLFVGQEKVQASGWFLPTNNKVIEWNQLYNVALSTNKKGLRVLWLYDRFGKNLAIEETRYERFSDILAVATEKAKEKNIQIENRTTP